MKRLYFLENNKIPYGYDFSQKSGIPSYIIFEVSKPFMFDREEDIWLEAPGYDKIVVLKKDIENNNYVKWLEL